MNLELEKRSQRLNEVVAKAGVSSECALVKAIRLPPQLFDQVRGAVISYVWHSLTQAYPEQAFLPSPSVLQDHAQAILGLPNRTPNGVLLPRSETFLSFNLIHQALVAMLRKLGMTTAFSSVQRACNVRILSGVPDPAAERRPLSSSKLHTDIWGGEPLSSILFNIFVLGDPEAVALEFFEPQSFPEPLRQRLPDYDAGAEMADQCTKCPLSIEIGTAYVSDALSLHRTIKRRPGLRVSIDFRCIATELLRGETCDSSGSRADYVPIDTWLGLGGTTILTSAEPLDAFQRQQRGEATAAATFTLSAIGSNFD